MEAHRSASKHGVSHDEVLHVVEHELVSVDLDPHADDEMIAIHATKLRCHFYELLPGEEGSP